VKFTDLKNVKPKNITLQDANKDYADYLYALPENKSKRQIWAVVGTIAAAVVIILGVSLWAIIGRGIRGTGEPVATPALPDDESVEITEQMQKDFEAMFGRYSLHSFPTFERDTLPSKEALLAFLEYEQGNFLADSKLTAEEFNEFVFDWFGKTPGYEVTQEYEYGKIITVDYLPPKLLTFTRSYLDDGTKTVTLTYGDVGHWVVTLSYVAVNDFEPDYFIEKTVLNTIYLQKIDKDKMIASVYKVSGKLATQILDAKRYLKHSESKCKCIPDYRVCDSTLWYDFMLDGINPHTTRYDNPTCKLTTDEQKKFKDLFEKCITEENFVETKPFEYTPSADKVTVTVTALTGKYKKGTHTITGDDAKALITALETKSYTGPNGLQAAGMIKIIIGDKGYSLYIDDDEINIENGCGGIILSKDNDIAKIVEKYIKNPEQTIIETGHSTYGKVTLVNATETCRAAINEHKVVDRANENPTTKTFEIDGKTVELTFLEKVPAPAAGGYVYQYTDSNEIWYGFYENKYFIDISDMGSRKKNPTVITNITKDEAFDIADKYARLMLGNDYKNYQITESEDFNSEMYRFTFEKTYGKDGFLSGETFGAFIYKNGRINSCSVINKYMF